MSLINQMLRDLESRRKTGERLLPSGEGPAVSVAKTPSRRLIYIVAAGVLVTGVVWSGLEFTDRLLQKPTASSKLVAVVAPVPATPVESAKPGEVSAAEDSVVTSPASSRPGEVEMSPATERRELVDMAGKEQQVATLLNLGVLETVASTRLLLEFEQLPNYHWSFQGEGETQVSFQLQQSATLVEMVIPQLQGVLLKQLQIVSSDQQELTLQIEAKQRVKLQTFELPADPFHGQRLLLEITGYQQAEVPTKKAAVEVVAVKNAARAEPEAAALPVKRVSKKAAVMTPAEQAAEAYQKGLQLLQNNDSLAAQKELARALDLQPLLLDARLQLVALAQKLGRSDQVEDYLMQGLKLHPGNAELRKSYARRLMEEGYLQGAIDILQSIPRPEFASDLEYYALLAALQQETGQHQAASSSYRQLLNYRPQQALWWMGLAISSEQTSDMVAAKEAYQQALALPGLRADLKDYISNRLQAL